MFNLGGDGAMKGLGNSIVGTLVALFVIALAAGAVAIGWRAGGRYSPI